MTPRIPVSYLLLGVLTGYAAFNAIRDGQWVFLVVIGLAGIHQLWVSTEWWNHEKTKLQSGQ